MEELLQGEPSIPSFKKPQFISKLSPFIQKILFFCLKRIYPRLYIFLENARKMTVE
jgi:hypothetical protein